jgi:hypothetical protein
MQLLTLPGSDRGRLLVLGAGNCNDLDLPTLLRTFSEVHLLDVDLEAMTLGVQRQGLHAESPIYLHGNVDVSGIMDRCAAWTCSPGSPGQHEIDVTIQDSLGHGWGPDYQGFDVTASIGLLSQLIEMTILALGEGHPNCLALLSAVRLRHIPSHFGQEGGECWSRRSFRRAPAPNWVRHLATN